MSGWTRGQAGDFAKAIMARWGSLWPHVSEEVRTALAHQHILSVVRMQMQDVRPRDIDALVADVEAKLGLNLPEGEPR